MTPLNWLAAVVDMLFSLPVLGRVAKWAWNSILTIVHFTIGMIEYLLMLVNIMPEKKIRLGIVLFRDEEDKLLTGQENIILVVEQAIEIYKTQAKIKLIPLTFRKGASENTEENDWVYNYPGNVGPDILDVQCNLGALLEDLWITGAKYQTISSTHLASTNFRRIVGYGAPIIVFIVRSIQNYGGCSLGPLSDYVTIHKDHLHCLAHEVGHACNLPHTKDKINLMHPNFCGNVEMTRWQISMVRASRHVTVF
ncbi:MAG: hypothetical protein N2D54_05400 [Chloroflexota bacterium]